MNSKTKARFEAQAKIIKAMAHPTRLFIIDELSRGERCVNELTQMIGLEKGMEITPIYYNNFLGLLLSSYRSDKIYKRDN